MLTSRGGQPNEGRKAGGAMAGEEGLSILAPSWQGGRTRCLLGFSLTGYHMPGGLEILLLFQSKLCEDEWTKRFLWDLHERLKQLETEQHCKLQFTTSSCFPSLNNPSDEFIIQVQLEGRQAPQLLLEGSGG